MKQELRILFTPMHKPHRGDFALNEEGGSVRFSLRSIPTLNLSGSYFTKSGTTIYMIFSKLLNHVLCKSFNFKLKLSTQEGRGCCTQLSTVSPVRHEGGPAHSWCPINILDEGSGSSMGSEFSMSRHRARVGLILSNTKQDAVMLSVDVRLKCHHPVNTWQNNTERERVLL